MTEQEEEQRRQEEVSQVDARRAESRDRQLTKLDEVQARDRMREAQERFVRIGLAVYLIAVMTTRGTINYSIELHRDGGRNLPVRDLQDIADELGLDLTFAGADSGDAILVDPRPQPNWSSEA